MKETKKKKSIWIN